MAVDQRKRLQRAAQHAGRGFTATQFLHAEVRQALLQRLQWLAIEPQLVIDLGAGSGAALPGLRAAYPAAQLLALDHAGPLLRQVPRGDPAILTVCARAQQMPLASHSADLVFASLMPAYCNDPPVLFAEIRRVLRSPGVLLFATLGRESFSELRSAWAEADSYTHVMPQPDMHDLAQLLLQAGFTEPVLDVDTLRVTYPDIGRMAADFRAVGSVNLSSRRPRGLTGRATANRLAAALDARRDSGGRIPVTLQVIFGLVWAGEASAASTIAGIRLP